MNDPKSNDPPLGEQALGLAEELKDAGAVKMGGAAQTIHGAADDLQNQMPQFAGYVHDAAGRLEEAADKIREHNLDDLWNNLSSLARQNPAAFFGGALLAGFAASRFFKSSSGQH